MKKHIALFIACVIIGIAVFAIFYWIFQLSMKEAGSVAITAGLTALIFEYLRPYIFANDHNGFFQRRSRKR
jgi:hypothetical protein